MSNSKLVPPRITISMVEGIMKRAAKGHSEAITELESLLAHYERPGSHRPDSDIKEVKAALTYAKAMAATRNSLHVFDLDVKRFMKQVLRGESDAFTRLVAIA